MKYIGGYSILDLTDANVSAQANACYNQDKPVLVYGANGERYFADTITKSGTSIIITKGGKTITIANDNTITNVGNIQNHLYLYHFKYSKGNDNIVSDIISNKDIDFSTITKEKLSLLLGDEKHTASGVVNYGDAEIAFVYSIYWDDDIFMLGSNSNADTDSDTLKTGIDANFDENITYNVYGDIVITKTQLF